jgi:hypothetical protein
VFQIVDFSSINDLKFTYVHLQFQKKIFQGLYPRTPMIKGRGKGGEGKGREGREGREGKEGRGRKGGDWRKGRDGMR